MRFKSGLKHVGYQTSLTKVMGRDFWQVNGDCFEIFFFLQLQGGQEGTRIPTGTSSERSGDQETSLSRSLFSDETLVFSHFCKR